MVKESDLQLALGMNERRKTGSLPVHEMHRWGVSGLNLGQTQSRTCLFNFVRSFPLQGEHLMEGFISLSVPFTETSPPRTATCSVSRDMRGTGAPVPGVVIPGGSP